jgi:hypothetical protein
MLDSQAIVARRIGVQARSTPTGAVLVDMETGQCFRLNQVGAEVWAMLEAPRRINEVCAAVAERYALPIEESTRDIARLFQELIGGGLVDTRQATSR